jgi:hypothetical protein
MICLDRAGIHRQSEPTLIEIVLSDLASIACMLAEMTDRSYGFIISSNHRSRMIDPRAIFSQVVTISTKSSA